MVLNGQRAIVIGGGSGIGLETALALLGAGASVVITGRTESRLRAARQQSGDRLEIAPFDASITAEVKHFFEAQAPFDHLVLCANAGGTIAPFDQIDVEEMRIYFDNKLWVYVNVLQHCAQRQRAGGSITLVNGAASRLAVKSMGALAIVNGGLDSVIRPLALERAPTRVNAISPGVIDTPYWAKLPAEKRDAMYAAAAEGVPVKRVGRPEDIAHAVVFFATNSFVTGVVLDVDGGRRLTPSIA